jgi:hypothetical protein
MSFLGKALIAATARKNTPPRFDDVETYRFGEYDVDLDEYLTSTTQFNSGVAEKYSMYRNGIRPISVNYSSDGLTYYLTRQHSSQTGNTTSTAYNQFEVAHLTLSRAHDLRTITSHTNVVVDFSDTEPDAAAAMSRNQKCKISWHNNGYNFTFIGRDSGNATNIEIRGYAFEVTTPYTGIGATKIDEFHDPMFTDQTEFHMSPSGGKAFVFNKGEWFYALTNTNSHGPFKLGNGVRGSQFFNPKRATYWNKIAHMSASNTSYCPARIFCDLNSNPAHIFYPYRTSTSETSSNVFYLQRHTSYQISNKLDVLNASPTVDEYNLSPMAYTSSTGTTNMNLYGHRDYGFSDHGLRLFILARRQSSTTTPYSLIGFHLATAFDPSSWNGSYTEINFSLVTGMNAGADDEVCAFCFNNRPTYQDSSSTTTNAIGTVLYVLRLGANSNREIYVFTLSTAWDLTTATLREIIPEASAGMTVANNVVLATDAAHKKAMYNSIIMHHPILEQTVAGRAAESLIVYPQCTATTDQQRPFVVYNYGTGWNYSIREDANDMVLAQAADHFGVGVTMDWPISERLYGFASSSTKMHQLGEPEYETTSSRQQIRRETYYRRIAVYDMDYYGTNNLNMFLDHNESGVSRIQDNNATLRGGSTGSGARVSWVDSYAVGPAKKFATVTWGAGSSQEALVYVLFQEIADNKDPANTGLACVNRYRLGGVEDIDMDFGQLSGYNGGNQTMNAGPITEIFSSIYTDGYDRIAAMFPVPQVAASGDDPALPARMGFIDDRGYCYYLESIGMKSTGVGSFPVPTAGNHPGGVTTGTAMGNALKYTRTANTISCHILFQDDLTVYDDYERYQRIFDFDFDPTGHVCCVLGMAASPSSDVRTVFVYYVDKPFSTNKDDWTYIISGSTASNTNTYRIKIVDGHVFIHDYDNDAITVSVDVDAILTNGPTYVHSALSFTNPLTSTGGSDFLWVDYNIDSVDGGLTYYNSIRADISGSQIYLYHGQVRASYSTLGTNFYTAYTTSGQIWWRVNGTATRPASVSYSERGMWYDKTHETFYFVHESSSANGDSIQRAPLRLYKSKVLDKDENGAGNWLIEEPTPYELKSKLPFAVETFKIYGDKIIFVEWQGRFMGSTRMR